MIMHQGKIDATLVSPDNLYEAEAKGLKLSILADLNELGIYTTASDLSARRDFLKNQRQRARAFMMAYCEAIWLEKTTKASRWRALGNRCERMIRGALTCCTKITWWMHCR